MNDPTLNGVIRHVNTEENCIFVVQLFQFLFVTFYRMKSVVIMNVQVVNILSK